jgi:RNA methyltransferase, TrmH family
MKNIITSKNNKFIKSLAKNIKLYDSSNEYCVVEGERALDVFSKSALYDLDLLIVRSDCSSNAFDSIDRNKILLVSSDVMSYLSKLKTSPGILGIFKCMYSQKEKIDFKSQGTYVLCNVSDPHNLGAIIRTAVALNRKYIIAIDGCHHHNQKAIRASAGMIGAIRVCRVSVRDVQSIFSEMKLKYTLDAKGKKLYDIEKSNDAFLFVGNEANGFDGIDVYSNIGKVSIPMYNDSCESLNAAVAASVAGYEIWRGKS